MMAYVEGEALALNIGLFYLISPLNKTSVSSETGALQCHSTPKFLSLEFIQGKQ